MNGVEKLFQLKYFGLRDTDISSLPSQIVMLSELVTIDLRGTRVQELPAGFLNLTKLQHLGGGKLTKIPRGIGTMTNLLAISGFNATLSPADALEELGKLTNLKLLRVYLECIGSKCGDPDQYRRHEEKLFASLQKLIGSTKLQFLHIHSDDGHSLECLESWSPMPSALQWFHMYSEDYHFINVPKWIAPSLASLSSLHISLTELTEDGLHTLGELPALLRLILALKTGEDKIVVPGIGFSSLKHFEITSLNGTYVTFLNRAMPRLEHLELEFSVSVGRNYGFYLGIVHLPCLKRAVIRVQSEGSTMSEIIAARAAIKEEVDFHTNRPTVHVSGNDEEESEENKDSEAN
jgi:disease resistance protein RPM1